MRDRSATMMVVFAIALCAAVVTPSNELDAQRPPSPLHLGGDRARSGTHALRAGFTPDPFSIPLRARGSISVAVLRLGGGCRGFIDAVPDLIVRWTGNATMLRFFARSEQDVTLIVADPSGTFRCCDDSVPGRNTNPMVDLFAPRPGQYDVWLGSKTSGVEVQATLFATTTNTERP